MLIWPPVEPAGAAPAAVAPAAGVGPAAVAAVTVGLAAAAVAEPGPTSERARTAPPDRRPRPACRAPPLGRRPRSSAGTHAGSARGRAVRDPGFRDAIAYSSAGTPHVEVVALGLSAAPGPPGWEWRSGCSVHGSRRADPWRAASPLSPAWRFESFKFVEYAVDPADHQLADSRRPDGVPRSADGGDLRHRPPRASGWSGPTGAASAHGTLRGGVPALHGAESPRKDRQQQRRAQDVVARLVTREVGHHSRRRADPRR